MTMNVGRWFHEHSLKLLAIRDTPEAIAGGVAIGIFFGFTPLLGLKTLSAIFFAWLTRSNIIAAVLAGTLHDVILPFMPIIYRTEYDVGYWLLSHPHRLPPPLAHMHWERHLWRDWTAFDWTVFFTVGKPTLVGSIVLGAPFALLSYFITRGLVRRHQERKHLHQVAVDKTEPNPS